MFNLIVTQPFDGHAVGDRISDADEVAKHDGRPGVVRVVATETPASAAMATAPAPEPEAPAEKPTETPAKPETAEADTH